MFKIKYTKKDSPEYKYGRLIFRAGGVRYVVHKCFEKNKYHLGIEGSMIDSQNYVVYTDEQLDEKFSNKMWELVSM